ncbi:transposable element Tcb2 transposase [Trichonephila clavipes]|uniref:Transposable element Tcb2 transposase n=1 Tax=Trichonephila clavipes TaxID=2585209 RepID=A0A8X6V1J8_TRICX|nr:transposable element Tcb2 transposase [Trichonephila clavipes]
MANNQSVRRHLDAFTRGRIIGKLEEGRSVTSVAAEFGIAHNIVSRLWRQFQTTGTVIRGFSSGRPRGTPPADDRRLHGGGLFARRPVRCVPLTPAHRRRRSLWCREHRNWRDNEWGRVLFTDESRFSLSSDSHRILIWRERGSHNHPSNIIERDRYGGRGVLVWGGIMLGSRTDLHILDAGSVNGTRYCNEILLPYVRLFRGAMGLQFLFMDDNAPCHRTLAAKQLLESEDIERMDWPERSPDLNPIEHVWDFLGRRLATRTLPPVTIRELRVALQDEWAAMPQQLIDTLILSMGRRCETCLAVREIISPTKDRMFLAGHPSQRCFGLQSHCAPCYFSMKLLFIPLISLLTTSGCFYPRSNHWEVGGRPQCDKCGCRVRIAHNIVSRLWRQFHTTGTAIRGFSSGCPRGTPPADDRYIVLQARRNRRQTAGEIARHTTQATGRQISRFTVARRLHGGGLFARRPVRCVPLTPAHRRRRSLWYREHRNWRDNEWGRVLFTDESRFSLSSDSHRILIWRER